MFRNLEAEMARNGIKNKDIARLLKCNSKTLNFKMSGKREFKLSEIKAIKAYIPGNFSLDFLFDEFNEGVRG